MQKKKRMEHVSFVLAVDGILVFIFTFKETFLLSYFSVTKSTKSQQREHSPLFANSLRVHELVARAVRGKCVRQRTERKSLVSRSPQSHTTTRANISHEKTEQIRARIACTPAISARRAWV